MSLSAEAEIRLEIVRELIRFRPTGLDPTELDTDAVVKDANTIYTGVFKDVEVQAPDYALENVHVYSDQPFNVSDPGAPPQPEAPAESEPRESSCQP